MQRNSLSGSPRHPAFSLVSHLYRLPWSLTPPNLYTHLPRANRSLCQLASAFKPQTPSPASNLSNLAPLLLSLQTFHAVARIIFLSRTLLTCLFVDGFEPHPFIFPRYLLLSRNVHYSSR